ncbi:MAG: cation transporter [Oscillibacter sp.]|nr:cation transporter [Oscillibacter sp.]
MKKSVDKARLFAEVPVPEALFTMAVPTIISQLINLIYNMVDAFFIGRTGNSYMMAATTITLTLFMMNVALSNLFGIGGGSLVARMMGVGKTDEARRVSAFALYGAAAVAVAYSLLIGLFLRPLLRFLGASDATMGYARSYALIVIALGSLPSILSMTLAHLLRNTGFSSQASAGLSGGGILNVLLDPLFMFVLLPPGNEVTGAAIATTLSNTAACIYLLCAYRKASKDAPLSFGPRDALAIGKGNVKALFSVGVPSAVLTGLFDLANICVNILAAAHNDLVLAGMGIVMKVERIPNAVNIGICQGMLPIVAYNYSSGNHARMRDTISTARKSGLLVSAVCVVLFEIFARPASRLFLSVSAGDAETALVTVGYAALFLRIRCTASPVQFLNYHTSYCMQAMGDGRGTLLHAFVREVVFYIPFMFLLDGAFGEVGLAAALIAGESCGAAFALYLLRKALKKTRAAA